MFTITFLLDSCNSDDFLGHIVVPVGEVIGAKDSILIKELKSKDNEDVTGIVIIKADRVPVPSK